MTNDQETMPCRICSKPTTMTGTKLCDGCWESERRASLAGTTPAQPSEDYQRGWQDGVIHSAATRTAFDALDAERAATPADHPLDAMLPDICMLLDTIKMEWTKQGAWSEWDQSVRDRITAYHLAKMAAPTTPAQPLSDEQMD